jgi:carbon monoxide dehydrogenase subunit G
MLLAALVLVAPAASAEELDRVAIGDLPGTQGHWQQGEVVVRAPAADVQRWLTDAGQWPARFPDVEWARQLGVTRDGGRVVQFRSRVIGRPMTVRIHEKPGLIVYDGEGKDVTTQGKNYVEPLGHDRTRVVMQTTAEVHGALGAFASAKMKRDRARRKLAADLGALVRLANRSAPPRE